MSYTVKEINEKAKALMFEKQSSNIYDSYCIPNLNRILMELFGENNVMRVFKGLNRLEAPQQVTKMTDVLVYEDEYVLNVIPIGLAARYSIDDDLNKYSIFDTDYNNARVNNLRIVSVEDYDNAT